VTEALVIFEPAAAVAAGRCLAARVRDRERWTTTDHPSRCGWCDYPTPVLDAMIRGFHAWAGYSERTGTYAHHEMRVWSETPGDAQRAAVSAAQALEVGPPPAPKAMEPAAAAPADAEPAATSPADPPRPDWLGGPS